MQESSQADVLDATPAPPVHAPTTRVYWGLPRKEELAAQLQREVAAPYCTASPHGRGGGQGQGECAGRRSRASPASWVAESKSSSWRSLRTAPAAFRTRARVCSCSCLGDCRGHLRGAHGQGGLKKLAFFSSTPSRLILIWLQQTGYPGHCVEWNSLWGSSLRRTSIFTERLEPLKEDLRFSQCTHCRRFCYLSSFKLSWPVGATFLRENAL